VQCEFDPLLYSCLLRASQSIADPLQSTKEAMLLRRRSDHTFYYNIKDVLGRLQKTAGSREREQILPRHGDEFRKASIQHQGCAERRLCTDDLEVHAWVFVFFQFFNSAK